MAAAYAYADNSGPIPQELRLLNAIDRFGASEVLGRPLGAGEIRRMRLAENVVAAYRSRQNSTNWATWAKENPDMNHLLITAMELLNDGNDS